MSLIIPGILLTIAMMCFINCCEGNSCTRTNLEPNENCASECIPSTGCYSRKKECLCDGDCGFSCVKKDLSCGTPLPKRLSNGLRIVNSTDFNATAFFTCDHGFTLSGSNARKCRGNGDWDGSKARCRKYCSDPGIDEYARRDEPIKKSGFKANTALHYYCLPNIQMQGKAIIKCQNNGEWSSPAPICSPSSCQSPTLPPNSRVIWPKSYDSRREVNFGTKLFLGCKPGYYRQGSNYVIICKANGQWQISNSFKCAPRSCGDPGIPMDGQRLGLLFHYTSNVSFTCDSCYKLVGVHYRICMTNGRWSDQQPICERAKCTKLLGLRNGKIISPSTECKAKAIYSCNKGYKLEGPKERRCDETGQWTGTTPKCKIVSCGKPDLKSPGLRHNGNTFYYGSVINFTCQHNYVMKGKNSTACGHDGRWSNRIPPCLAPCKMKTTKNAISDQKKVFKDGERLILFCLKGYIPLGHINKESPKCSNGTWTSKLLYCDIKKEKKKQFSFLG